MNVTSLITAQLNLVCFQDRILEAMVVSVSVNFNAEGTAAMHIFHTQVDLREHCLACKDGQQSDRVRQ